MQFFLEIYFYLGSYASKNPRQQFASLSNPTYNSFPNIICFPNPKSSPELILYIFICTSTKTFTNNISYPGTVYILPNPTSYPDIIYFLTLNPSIMLHPILTLYTS